MKYIKQALETNRGMRGEKKKKKKLAPLLTWLRVLTI